MTAHLFSFYSPSLGEGDAAVELAEDEFHHLARVLRLDAGANIRVTNGRGLMVGAVVDRVGKASAVARVTSVEASEPRPRRLVLALALLPRVRFETALAQCVEVGITGLLPIRAERCHVRERVGGSGRLERVAVAAMKQSGRAWLPVVEAAVGVDELVARFGTFRRVVLADAGAAALSAPPSAAVDTLAMVGPEAGFTGAEVSRFIAAGAEPASLSEHRLRTETAAVVMISMLAARRGRN